MGTEVDEVDPVEYARVIERLTGAITNIKESFANFQVTQRSFSDTVLERFLAYEKESALNERARGEVAAVQKQLQDHLRDYDSFKGNHKAWMTVGMAISTVVGGIITSYVAGHLK